ncbi:MAG: FHA domain-containing protein [Polyangiaceae bacterium]|jgi:hypothetical protein
MGSIREHSTGRTQVLEPEHLVGRAALCALRLDPRYVSGQHAVLRWTGVRWELKDLGSRNGTFIDGARVKPAEDHPIRRGAVIAFGTPEERWEIVDDSAPCAMAVPLDGGEPVLQDGDLLALPSADDPRATIYRAPDGSWILEQPNESPLPVANLQTFELEGRSWRFCCVENVPKTSIADPFFEVEVWQVHLTFYVSRDEEFVRLAMTAGENTIDMGSRAHNYLLLTLARRRLADAQAGFADPACGWIDHDELAHDPTMAPPQLNIDVFRIRRQFAGAGVLDAVNIVERRTRSRQLRLGTGRISIEQL